MTIALYRTIVFLLLILNFSGALIAGYSFMSDPSGTEVGISVDWLKHSPFQDYFVPGLILFLVNGVYGVFVFSTMFLRLSYYPVLVIVQGILLGGWILVQMALLRTINFLQTTCFIMAISFLIFGFFLFKHQNRKKKKNKMEDFAL